MSQSRGRARHRRATFRVSCGFCHGRVSCKAAQGLNQGFLWLLQQKGSIYRVAQGRTGPNSGFPVVFAPDKGSIG